MSVTYTEVKISVLSETTFGEYLYSLEVLKLVEFDIYILEHLN